MFSLFKKRMNRKANAGLNIMMIFGGLAVGLLVFAVTMVLFNVFIAQTKSMTIVSADANATTALNKVQSTGNSLIDWSALAILIGVFGALIAGMVLGGLYAYQKFRG